MTNEIDDATCQDYGSHRPSTRHDKDDCPVEIKDGRDKATRKEYAQIARETYAQTAYQIAERLRDTADRVQGAAVRIAEAPKDGEHVAAAKRAIHELMWGLANASAERLVSDAAEADRAAREANR